jgi:hypothetical protein
MNIYKSQLYLNRLIHINTFLVFCDSCSIVSSTNLNFSVNLGSKPLSRFFCFSIYEIFFNINYFYFNNVFYSGLCHSDITCFI